MNPNIEYEKFTREVYQKLLDADVVKTTEVKHNVKLTGKSGQKHQIDVYWEYEIEGVRRKVAIECKNYNKAVSLGKVRDFLWCFNRFKQCCRHHGNENRLSGRCKKIRLSL